MIKIFETKLYSSEIIELWQEAFGDSREDVIFFLENCKNKSCLCLESDKELKAMLFLVDTEIDDVQSKYIYAACTKKNCRKNGYMSMLLRFALDKYDSVALIPANEPLVDYYMKRGLDNKISIDSLKFDESKEINEYLFEGCELVSPFALQYRR